MNFQNSNFLFKCLKLFTVKNVTTKQQILKYQFDAAIFHIGIIYTSLSQTLYWHLGFLQVNKTSKITLIYLSSRSMLLFMFLLSFNTSSKLSYSLFDIFQNLTRHCFYCLWCLIHIFIFSSPPKPRKFKVGLSPSKIIGFIWFNKSSLIYVE